MPSRRSHTNSHHGCLQCKAKRVKCDQAQPKCSRCDKKNSECTYRHIMTNYNPFQYQQAARAAAAAAAAAGEGSSKGGAAGGRGSGPQPVPSTPALAYTTTTMTQTTPPKATPGPSSAGPMSASASASASRSSSAPATPGLAATTAHGPHASSWSGVRKTSLSYHPQRPRVPTTPAPNADRILRAIPTQANIKNKNRQQPPSSLTAPPPIPPQTLLGEVPTSMLLPSTTPTETTVGFTPAAMTIVTDPFTFTPVTTAPTPTTLVTTPSPPLLSHSLPLLPPLHDDDRFYLDHYSTNLTGLGFSPVLESELFTTINAAILRHLSTSTHVQHVIIAYAALHLASKTPYPSTTHAHHLSAALHHKALALENFRPAIEAGITRDNSEPLLATAAVLVTCGFALPVADPGRRTQYNHIDLVAEIFGLIQGTSAILQAYGVEACKQEAKAALAKIDLPSPVGDAPWSEGDRSLQTLQYAIEAIPPVSEAERNRRSLLLHSLGKLRRCIEYVGAATKATPITCLWLSMVHKDFIHLITQRDQLALALIAHWAVHHRGNAAMTWWTHGWLETFMKALQQTIHPEHQHLINWCVARLEQSPLETYGSSAYSVG